MARRGDGLRLRGKTWYLDFIHNGERYQPRLGRNISRTAALELSMVEKAKILKAEQGIGRKRKDVLFDDAVQEFLKWAEANKRPKTLKTYRGETKQLMKSFGGKKLSEIHPFLIEKHKQSRIKADARVSANRELTCLKSIFNRCIEWKKFEGENPAKSVKPTKEPKNRTRFLSYDEEDQLLKHCKEPLRTVVLSCIHAGLRMQAESLTLQLPNVDLARRLLTVEAGYAKNGETRTIEINSVLFEALARLLQRPQQSEFVFLSKKGKPYKSIRTAFTTACRNAKLSGVSPHVLRHTFASRLAMAGVDLRTIQELGGWKDIKMVERYAHLLPSHKAAAIEKTTRPAEENSTTLVTTLQVVPA